MNLQQKLVYSRRVTNNLTLGHTDICQDFSPNKFVTFQSHFSISIIPLKFFSFSSTLIHLFFFYIFRGSIFFWVFNTFQHWVFWFFQHTVIFRINWWSKSGELVQLHREPNTSRWQLYLNYRKNVLVFDNSN